MILPWSINRSYQAVHWLITFCSSSGERFLSHFVPRNNSMYSDVVCVLILLVFLSVILRRSGSRTRCPCSTHSVRSVQPIQCRHSGRGGGPSPSAQKKAHSLPVPLAPGQENYRRRAALHLRERSWSKCGKSPRPCFCRTHSDRGVRQLRNPASRSCNRLFRPRLGLPEMRHDNR